MGGHEERCVEDHEQILQRISTHKHPEIEELADAVVGPRLSPLAGGGRNVEEGVVRRLERMEAVQIENSNHLQNGIKIKLRVPWALWIALVAGFATVLAAVIESSGSG